jgi:glycosyltransferase involved in cell wall biosynthesis
LNSPVSSAGFRGLYNPKAYRTISNWIARNDTPNTIYHLHGWSKILSPAVFFALRPVARRVVASAHDFFLVCPNGGYFDYQSTQPCTRTPMSVSCLTRNCDRRNFTHKVWRSLRQFIGQTFRDIGCDKITVVAVHEGMLDHLELGGIQRSQLRILHNPVTAWRSERVLAEGNTCFVYVGRLEPDKGVDLLAEAVTRAGVKLRVIGQGPLSEMLSARYPSIEQAGWRNRSEIADLIKDARALVMPTRGRETFGLAAMEAMTSGLPVIVSKNAMISDDIHRRGFGFSCDPFDIAALSDTLLRFAQDNDLVQKMSQRAYDGARALALAPEDWVDALLDIYLDVLASGGMEYQPTS